MCDEECVICTEKITIFSIGECNHTNLCYSCCFRSRVIYGDTTCPMCRHKNDPVYYSKKLMTYDEISKQPQAFNFKQFGVKTNDKALYNYLKYLLSNTCKYCRKDFKTAQELNQHYKQLHHVQFCDVCLKYQKAFICDKTVYTDDELEDHLEEFDTETQVKTHPECEYCHESFYDLEMLFKHLNEKHESCFICYKLLNQNTYYKNYEELFKHFQKEHFVCDEHECLTKRYVAFGTDEELTNHRIAFHMKKGEKIKLESGTYFEQSRTYGRQNRRYQNYNSTRQYQFFREEEHKEVKEEEEKEVNLSLENFPRLGNGANVNKNETQSQSQFNSNQHEIKTVKRKQKKTKEMFPSLSSANNNNVNNNSSVMKEAYQLHAQQERKIGDLNQRMKDILKGRYERFVKENEEFKNGKETPSMFLDRFHRYFGHCEDEKEMLAEFINNWPNEKQKKLLIQTDNERNEELTKIKMRDEMFMSAQIWEEEQQKRIKKRMENQVIPESERQKIVDTTQTSKSQKKKKKQQEMFPSLASGRNLPVARQTNVQNWNQIYRTTSTEAQAARQKKKDLENAKLTPDKFPKLGSK